MKSILAYLTGVRAELTHVKWPGYGQAVAYTALVIIISLVTAAVLGFFDYLFTLGVEFIITR